jgi:metal-responsive CopG/Arc/MetJ family transcriptional regulator
MVSYNNKTEIVYKKIGMPKEMVDEIERIIENDRRFGFVSVQEFVRDAVRANIVLCGGTHNEPHSEE